MDLGFVKLWSALTIFWTGCILTFMERHEIATRALNLFPGAKVIAVRNFVGSLTGSGLEGELANLLSDAKSYGWNQDTINAIEYGIDTFYNQLN